MAVSENECCICICVCERKRDRDKHRSKSNPAGPVVNSLPSYSGDVGLIPGLVTKIPHVVLHSQKKKKDFKKYSIMQKLKAGVATVY